MASSGRSNSRRRPGHSPPGQQDPVSKLDLRALEAPGIGEKTATRLAYFILKQDAAYSRALSERSSGAKQKIGLCTPCFTFTDRSLPHLLEPERDQTLICVVERPADVFSIEQAGAFRGVYHVLHGALSPLDGIGPEELKIRELLARVKDAARSAKIILATNPSVEGEATALYLARLIKPLGYQVTKLAHGFPSAECSSTPIARRSAKRSRIAWRWAE